MGKGKAGLGRLVGEDYEITTTINTKPTNQTPPQESAKKIKGVATRLHMAVSRQRSPNFNWTAGWVVAYRARI